MAETARSPAGMKINRPGPVHGQGKDAPLELEASFVQELQGQRDELVGKVGALKADLSDWRRRLDANVACYKAEVAKLRGELTNEVDALKAEFLELKAALRQQLEATTALAKEAQLAAMPPELVPQPQPAGAAAQ